MPTPPRDDLYVHSVPADLEGALDGLGVEIYRTNDDEVQGWCPQHEERTGRQDSNPSWSVNRDTGFHNCFSCGYSGTFQTLAMDLKFTHDVFRAERYIKSFGYKFVEVKTAAARVEEKPHLLTPETKLAMFDPEIPQWALDARMLSQEACTYYDIRWDAADDAWIIPIRYPDGDLAGWQKKWQRKRLFLNVPRSMPKSDCLFGYSQFHRGDPAVLVEAPLDCARIYTAGYTGGVSSFGARWSVTQMRLILELTNELVSALDDDKDGRLAAEELRSGRYDKHRLVLPPWSGRMSIRYFAYDGSQKDPGDMVDEAITRALYEAEHSSIAVIDSTHPRNNSDFHQHAPAVPGRTRGQDGGSRKVRTVRGNRNRQDSHDDRGDRTSRRGVPGLQRTYRLR